MRNLSKIFMIVMLVSFLAAGSALALDFGKNITIADQSGATLEDGDVEPGSLIDQTWDLEAFFLDSSILTMVGGYDFVTGVGENWGGSSIKYEAGDLFIDIDGDVAYGDSNDGTGSGNTPVSNSFGYDYVVDMDFDTLTYTVYGIDENAIVVTSKYADNDVSNPWRYSSGGTLVSTGGIIGYIDGLTDSEVGLMGDEDNNIHNAASVDLSFLGESINKMTVHFTMECGNDNLMGNTPEPATMLLLGSGLMGFAGLRRRFRKN